MRGASKPERNQRSGGDVPVFAPWKFATTMPAGALKFVRAISKCNPDCHRPLVGEELRFETVVGYA
ncbi:hypothetical protein AM571_CH01171 [Rhizobium etli 8C-3]|uniref:Uncharacterized protein n=1 Tax=Rhizobium etli 8C-3 TaxID=538025 RepID=A0A1L5P1K2_RHIET|nr:hypothetical protein AM571_CH01171 [Rhizobium etli 8C-3]